jgi:small subunit ribosomal protein S6
MGSGSLPAAAMRAIVPRSAFPAPSRRRAPDAEVQNAMAFYEHVLIARQDISPTQAETLNEELKALIEGQGGHVAKIEYWGLRNLSYRIRKNRKGHYSLLAIDAAPAAVKEMERQLSLNEDVLRYLTLRVDQLDLELSPILARRDRERRFDDIPA